MTVNSDLVIISLEEVMTDYKGKLSALLHRQKQKPNILVTWQVEIEVKKAGKQRFFISVAVCFLPLIRMKKSAILPASFARKVQPPSLSLFQPIALVLGILAFISQKITWAKFW